MAISDIRTKFSEKAVFIYACPQIAEGIPATQIIGKATYTYTAAVGGNPATGTITRGATDTSDYLAIIPIGIYIRHQGTGTLLGQVTARTNTTITLSDPFATSIATEFTFSTVLGPKNKIAALNLNFSIDLTSEAFQYAGDELDRDELTVITDKIGKFDFESFSPILTTATTTNDLFYSNFFKACGFTVSQATSALGTKAASKIVKVTNTASASNTYLTVEIHRASPDMPLNDKVYKLTDVRGTMDFTAVIGTRPKLKWNMMGNFQRIVDQPKRTETATDVDYYNLMKKSVLGTASSENVTKANLGNLSGISYKVAIPDAAIPADTIITLGGLQFTVKVPVTVGTSGNSATAIPQIISYFVEASSLLNDNANLTLAELNALLELSATTGQFTSKNLATGYEITNDTSVTSGFGVWAKPVKGYEGKNTLVFSIGSSALTKTIFNSTSTEYTLAERNICFDKLNMPNIAGFEFTRYKTGCGDGWSKSAVPTDVTMTILEDAAGAAFNPYRTIEDFYDLWFEVKSGNSYFVVNYPKLQLTNVSQSAVANFVGNDLTFRNVGSTTLYFVGYEGSLT